MFSSRAHAKMSAVQKLSRFQVRFLQHARRRRRLDSLACVRVPVPSSYSGAVSTQAAASGVKTWNESSLLSPAVRFLLGTNNIDPSLITPTGPNNRLLKSDILQYLEDVKTGRVQSEKPPTSPPPRPVKPVKQPVPPSTEVSYTDIPVDSMRRAIAQNVTLSKTTIPYSYATVECNMDELLELRRKLKNQGVLLTVNDFLIKAAALTMECLPQCNAVWSGNDVQLLPTVDISVAVATESGLITPIIKETNKLSVENISTTVKELASRARGGQLQPHEFQGGGFSISNLGLYGVTEFTAIINPLQASILAVGTLQVALSEQGTPYRYINTTLSSDVRVINYELACRWLEGFKRVVEAPNSHGLL